MKPVPSILVVIFSSLSIHSSQALLLPEVNIYSGGARPFFPEAGPGLSLPPVVPGIIKYSPDNACSHASPPMTEHSLLWEDIIEQQNHPVPEALAKAIEQWLIHEQEPDFIPPPYRLPIPTAGPTRQLIADYRGLHLQEISSDTARVRQPSFTVLINTDTFHFLMDYSDSDLDFHTASLSREWMEDVFFWLFLQQLRIAVIDAHGQEVYGIRKNGRLVYITRQELKELYQAFLLMLQMLAHEQLMAFIESIGEPVTGGTVRIVQYGRGGTPKCTPQRKSKRLAKKRPKSDQPQDQQGLRRSKRFRQDPDGEQAADNNDNPRAESPEPQPQPEVETPAKRSGFTDEELDAEKKKILQAAKKTAIFPVDITDYDTRVFSQINEVMANALVHLGEVIDNLSTENPAPPETGAELAERIRSRFAGKSKESQYLARMIRHFQVLPPEYYSCTPYVLKRYKSGLFLLLQYIALESGRWLLPHELFESWLEYEDEEWKDLFPDFPEEKDDVRVLTDEWAGIVVSREPEKFETMMKDLGPALYAEIIRFRDAVLRSKDEDSPYQPEKDLSFFYVLGLIADDVDIRTELMSWIKALDPRYPGFFVYANLDWQRKVFQTLPSYRASGGEDHADDDQHQMETHSNGAEGGAASY